uniref:Uncharacterized protein n=1 Tax=Globodera rostochiensis TaxID=31243 RepID=A0A914HDA8_GLORO
MCFDFFKALHTRVFFCLIAKLSFLIYYRYKQPLDNKPPQWQWKGTRSQSVIVGSVEENELMVVNGPHRAHNVCGVLMGSYVITAPADDSLRRDLALYELLSSNGVRSPKSTSALRCEKIHRDRRIPTPSTGDPQTLWEAVRLFSL